MLRRVVNNSKADGVSHGAGKAGVERGWEQTASISIHGREISKRGGGSEASDPASSKERGDGLKAASFVLRVEVGLRVETKVNAKSRAVFAVGQKCRRGASELRPAVLEDVLRAANEGGIRLGKEG
jgi:hypothetical protein